MFGKAKRVLIAFLVFIFAISLVSPASASVGITIGTPINGTENVIYGNASNGSGGNALLLLQNQSADRFKVDRTGAVTAAGDICGNGKCLSTSASQWTSGSGLIYYNSGSVGIGTTNPTNQFVVKSAGSTFSVANDVFSFINDNAYTTAATRFYLQDANNNAARLTFDFRGNNGSTNIIAGTSAGNVGIGIVAPTAKLHIYGGSYPSLKLENAGAHSIMDIITTGSFESGIRFYNGANREGEIYAPSGDGTLRINASGGADALTVAGNANVGIGTISPPDKLTVYSAAGNDSYLRVSSPDGYISGIKFGEDQNSPQQWGGQLTYDGSTDLIKLNRVRGTTVSNALTVDSNGNVGIGTTAPGNKLEVHGTAAIGQYTNGTAVIDAYGSYAYFGCNAANNGIQINPSGNVAVTGTLSANTFLYMNGKQAIQSNDGYLRLNQNGDFGNGVYTPGILRTDGGIYSYTGGIQSGTSHGVPGTGIITADNYVYAYNYLQAPTVYVNGIGLNQDGAYIRSYSANNSSGGYEILRNDGNRFGYFYGDNGGVGILSGAGSWAVRSAGSVNGNNTDIIFYTGAETERMRIDSSGNVGIGTSAPPNKLSVVGAGPLYLESAGETDIQYNDTAEAQKWEAGTNSNGWYVYDDNGAGYSLTVKKGTGYVGIGTTAPSAKLGIVAGSGDMGIRVDGAGTGGYFSGSYGIIVSATVDGIDASGNYNGVNGSGNNAGVVGSGGNYDFFSQGSGSYGYYESSGAPNYFAGRIGIGSNSWVGNEQVLVQNDSDGPQLYVRRSNSGKLGGIGVVADNTNAQLLLMMNGSSRYSPSPNTAVIQNSGSSQNGLLFEAGSNWGMMIDSSGRVGIEGNPNTSYTFTVNGSAYSSGGWSGSDIRWKKDITPLEDSLAKVLKLQGVNYYWNTKDYPNKGFTDGQQIGLIAQDVEKVLPDLVMTDNEGYKAISYEKLAAVLVESTKEQQKQIEELKKDNEDLKARVEALEAGK